MYSLQVIGNSVPQPSKEMHTSRDRAGLSTKWQFCTAITSLENYPARTTGPSSLTSALARVHRSHFRGGRGGIVVDGTRGERCDEMADISLLASCSRARTDGIPDSQIRVDGLGPYDGRHDAAADGLARTTRRTVLGNGRSVGRCISPRLPAAGSSIAAQVGGIAPPYPHGLARDPRPVGHSA
jgi:hypothetical protein